MTETTALAVRPAEMGSPLQLFEPRSLQEAIDLAKILSRSQLMPRHLRTPEDCLLVMIKGRELGLMTMQAAGSMHVIEGKVGLAADLIVALVKRHPDCLFFRLAQSTDKVAVYETQRRGDPEVTRLAYTIEQAQAAGLLSKDNWKRHPAAMLRARCGSALARASYPDAVLGIYDTDETEEIARATATIAEVVRPNLAPGATLSRDEEPSDPAAATRDVPRAEGQPEPSAEMKETAHHELRMLITAARDLAQLHTAGELIAEAKKKRRLSKSQLEDLIEYGALRKADLTHETQESEAI